MDYYCGIDLQGSGRTSSGDVAPVRCEAGELGAPRGETSGDWNCVLCELRMLCGDITLPSAFSPTMCPFICAAGWHTLGAVLGGNPLGRHPQCSI